MIRANIAVTNNNRIKVSRVCDNCGKVDEVYLSSVYFGRQRRGMDFDCCKKCSYFFRINDQPIMQKSVSWKGGRYLTENGYYRVYQGNGKYAYEHKIVARKHFGRSLTKDEKVHHIDLNKINNDPANFFVCRNKRQHSRIHSQLEELGLSFLKTAIWYNEETFKYQLSRCRPRIVPEVDISDLLKYKVCKSRRHTKCYLRFTQRRKNLPCLLHTAIIERLVNRRLNNNEVVHHVDGDTLNNDVNNLRLMTRKAHTRCHYSLQTAVTGLYQSGFVVFDRRTGMYRKKNTE